MNGKEAFISYPPPCRAVPDPLSVCCGHGDKVDIKSDTLFSPLCNSSRRLPSTPLRCSSDRRGEEEAFMMQITVAPRHAGSQ